MEPTSEDRSARVATGVLMMLVGAGIVLICLLGAGWLIKEALYDLNRGTVYAGTMRFLIGCAVVGGLLGTALGAWLALKGRSMARASR